MNRTFILSVFYVLGVVSSVKAQEVDPVGIRMGNFVLEPEVIGLTAYDSRALLDEGTNESTGDGYVEAAASAKLRNQPALYRILGNVEYGQRFYFDLTEQDDDFYSAGIKGERNADRGLILGASARVVKALNFDYVYNSESGDRPDSIVSSRPSRRFVAEGNIGYAIAISERTAVVPEYALKYYQHEFEDDDRAEWQTHDASLTLNYALSEKTTLLVGGFYTLQTNEEEEGTIVTLGGGAKGRISEKTAWSLKFGVVHVDYDLSGSDEGGIVDVALDWQATEKLSLYLFSGNSYEPGYAGGRARVVYRAGYGGRWTMTDRWLFGVQMLHDYTEEVGSGTSTDRFGSVHHYFTSRLQYAPTQALRTSLLYRYINDEFAEDQQVISLSLSYKL